MTNSDGFNNEHAKLILCDRFGAQAADDFDLCFEFGDEAVHSVLVVDRDGQRYE